MTALERFLTVLREVSPHFSATHKLRPIVAADAVFKGADPDRVSGETAIDRRRLDRGVAALGVGELAALIGKVPPAPDDEIERTRFRIAQLLLGSLTEERFDREKEELVAGRLIVEDHRPGRTATDYRVLNGGGRPIFRINIKFHGSAFQQAQTWVQLAPEDCFALATYKIHQALEKQREEALPYVFVVLTCLGVTARMVADLVPPDYAWFVCIAARFGKRDTEEAIVEKLLGPEYAARFEDIRGQISRSEFRVVSASRAERLMKDRLFERVFALRHRGFTRGFRNAEVDMHFSVSRELIPVREFLALVARESPQRLTVLLDRGEIA